MMLLRQSLVKLAHENPELRRDLVPLLRKYAETIVDTEAEAKSYKKKHPKGKPVVREKERRKKKPEEEEAEKSKKQEEPEKSEEHEPEEPEEPKEPKEHEKSEPHEKKHEEKGEHEPKEHGEHEEHGGHGHGEHDHKDPNDVREIVKNIKEHTGPVLDKFLNGIFGAPFTVVSGISAIVKAAPEIAKYALKFATDKGFAKDQIKKGSEWLKKSGKEAGKTALQMAKNTALAAKELTIDEYKAGLGGAARVVKQIPSQWMGKERTPMTHHEAHALRTIAGHVSLALATSAAVYVYHNYGVDIDFTHLAKESYLELPKKLFTGTAIGILSKGLLKHPAGTHASAINEGIDTMKELFEKGEEAASSGVGEALGHHGLWDTLSSVFSHIATHTSAVEEESDPETEKAESEFIDEMMEIVQAGLEDMDEKTIEYAFQSVGKETKDEDMDEEDEKDD